MLDLPREIRDRIYSFAFLDLREPLQDFVDLAFATVPPLAQTCRIVRNECARSFIVECSLRIALAPIDLPTNAWKIVLDNGVKRWLLEAGQIHQPFRRPLLMSFLARRSTDETVLSFEPSKCLNYPVRASLRAKDLYRWPTTDLIFHYDQSSESIICEHGSDGCMTCENQPHLHPGVQKALGLVYTAPEQDDWTEPLATAIANDMRAWHDQDLLWLKSHFDHERSYKAMTLSSLSEAALTIPYQAGHEFCRRSLRLNETSRCWRAHDLLFKQTCAKLDLDATDIDIGLRDTANGPEIDVVTREPGSLWFYQVFMLRACLKPANKTIPRSRVL